MYVIKAEVPDAAVPTFRFERAKTMYGGKRVAVGDTVFVFASENEGGRGLVASGVATVAEALPRLPGVARQTPRVRLVVRRTASATRALGRAELKAFANAAGRPEAELHFKLYRQATDKLVGVTPATAAFLAQCCGAGPAVRVSAPRRRGRRA